MKKYTLPTIVTLALLATLLTAGVALAQEWPYWCRPVQTAVGFDLQCINAPTATPAPTSTPLPTATPTATAIPPTAVPPTATPVPTVAPVVDPLDTGWHAPQAHGDRPAHEHGDAPPAWLTDRGINPSYLHAHGTVGENVAYWKHTGFKGWAGEFQVASGTVRWYGVFHLDGNPGGFGGRFHSFQLWALDPSGNLSQWSGWQDYGTGNSTGSQKVTVCGTDSAIRPIIMVNQANPPCTAVVFENWYSSPSGLNDPNTPAEDGLWRPDFGANISPNYRDVGSPTDPSTWQSINGAANNRNRRIEWAWYAERSPQRGQFYADQFGRVVSGPDDPWCKTGTRTVGERTYAIQCSLQVIQPTMPSVTFNTVTSPGRNSVQRTFPGPGVVLPN
jgi:hypothetical protein